MKYTKEQVLELIAIFDNNEVCCKDEDEIVAQCLRDLLEFKEVDTKSRRAIQETALRQQLEEARGELEIARKLLAKCEDWIRRARSAISELL